LERHWWGSLPMREQIEDLTNCGSMPQWSLWGTFLRMFHAKKTFWADYYWPTMFKDTHCHPCQRCAKHNLHMVSLAPFNRLGHFSIFARVTSANPSHSTMLMVSFPKPRIPKFVARGPTLPHLHSGHTVQSVIDGVRWTSINGSPTLRWSSHCRSNTTTTRAILGNYAFILGQCPWKHCGSALGGWGDTTSPI
jgi:hypothetical protein